ncbi:MAG: zinc-binding dehydrogenase [Actinophytocola sp.]|uniref:NADP-dependent oxidoreductase n=1 Tax=Actinophytocola sp. TaxID=1872138 RepID=UPI001328160A|nr:NADP-dependent oxidoreductase [Actinophytocola sp.]MPZ85994.1 zinc-binding dehydrogenase [Actinophytocola sp.]
MPTTTREIHLAARPVGWPEPTDFALVPTELPDPAGGQLVVRNLFMSVDPYMRPKMNDVKSYTPPYELGKPLYGGAVGEVVESRVDGFVPGDLVLHGLGWREHALLDASGARKLEQIAGVAVSHYLGALGSTGLTAYVGLLDMAEFRAGDTVFVSGAAGAVGTMAGQIARLRGAKRVIGSAGSAEKVAHLTEKLGFDAAFNYRDGHLFRQLADAAPDGIEVYFDNVGGDHLEAAIGVLNVRGRVAMCGSVSQYNATEPPPGPRNLSLAVGKRLSLRGFIVTDHYARFPDMIREVGGWLRNGDLVVAETIVDGGLDKAVDAFLGMLRGDNTGKAVVRLS